MIKQEGLYQNKVTVRLTSIRNCKMSYYKMAHISAQKNNSIWMPEFHKYTIVHNSTQK